MARSAESTDGAPRPARLVPSALEPDARVHADDSRLARGHRRALAAAFALVLGVVAFLAFAPDRINRSNRRVDVSGKTVESSRDGSAKTRGGVPQHSRKPKSSRPNSTSRRSHNRSSHKRSFHNRSSHKRSSPAASAGKASRTHRAQPGIVSTRVFIWPAVSHAASYKVEFFRGGRKIFQASPATPRLELPLSWTYKGREFRLTPGTYAWRVSPAFSSGAGVRYGKPIIRSRWVVRG